MSTLLTTEAGACLRDPMLPQLGRVERRHRELPDTVTLEIVPYGDTVFPPWQPGQFTMVTAFGIGEIPLSISGNPADASRLVHTIRSVSTVSDALTQLGPGDLVGMRGPFGTAWPMAEAEGCDVVVVTGGIGLAPLRPAIHHLLTWRQRYGKVVLLYGARSPEHIMYRRQIESWRRSLDMQIEVSVDRADGDWRGNVGVVTLLIPRLAIDVRHTAAMVCGPEVMMRAAAAALNDMGVVETAIHLSLERNMKCGLGHCGHCQIAGLFVCKEGAVLRYDRIRHLLALREL